MIASKCLYPTPVFCTINEVSASSPRPTPQLRVPGALQMMRGRYTAKLPIDRKLLQLARDIRATQAGIRPENFREFNLAVARVRVDGRLEYLDAGNIPGKMFCTSRGLDSEQLILTQIHGLKKQRKAVILEQLYSERIPCKDCQDKLNHEFSEAAVFYTVPELRGQSRGESLMRAYGLEPPKA